MLHPSQQSTKDIFASYKTRTTGLSSDTVNILQKDGKRNVLTRGRKQATRFKIFLDQWKSPLILILVVASLVSAFFHDWVDTAVIAITVLVNVAVGFLQENKANRALESLQEMITYHAVVLRDGQKQRILSTDIVIGDILLLEAGDKVQADGRLIAVHELLLNESPLTGESAHVRKTTSVIVDDVQLGDRVNMVFRGTTVVNGSAQCVVTAIGGETEIGKIATLVAETKEEQTPLQSHLKHVSRILGIVVFVISVLIFCIGIFWGRGAYSMFELFETAVAVAVAAIPEGLIISLTVILAIGMQHILKRGSLVRKLVAAETLGSVSVICTDKTGTLTEGVMRVTRLVTSTKTFAEDSFATLSSAYEDDHQDECMAIRIGLLCNNAILEDVNAESHVFFGDSTETALAILGENVGFHKHVLDESHPRIDELSFDSRRKYMATLHHLDNERRLFVKGAPEVLLKRASFILSNGKQKKMTKKLATQFENQIVELSSQGLRLLALCYKGVDNKMGTIHDDDVSELIFVGMVALADPLRNDVKETLLLAKTAGIRVVMITGDHAETARAIAREIGLPSQKKNVLDGEGLAKMSDKELQSAISTVSVFARVDPKDKIRIVEAFQANGEVVAMTGDGVNDGPALKGADIGVALGSGTDVAKETADIVLLDDRFATIVSAVEEGRAIYQNIKKVLLYLLSGSFAEVGLITGSVLFNLPLAILPTQILWINLIQDSFPNLALAFDKGEKENMRVPPRKRSEPLIDTEMKSMIVVITVVSNIVLFGLYIYFLRTTDNLTLTRTIIFAGLGINSLLYIYAVRSMRRMVWQTNPFNNHYLTSAVLFGWVVLLLAIYWPPLQYLLHTVALGWYHWGILLGFGVMNVFLIEVVKRVFLGKVRVSKV